MEEDVICHKATTFTKLCIEYIKENKGLFAMYVCYLLVIPLRDIGLPHLISKLYNVIQQNKSTTNIIFIICIVIVIINLGYLLADFVEAKMLPGIQRFFRTKMIEHLFTKYSTEYEDLEIADLVTKFLKLPITMYNYLEQLKAGIIPSLIVVIISCFYFMYIDIVLGLTLLCITIVFGFCIYYAVTKCTEFSTERDRQMNRIFKHIDDMFRNMITVMSFNNMHDEMNMMEGIDDLYAEKISQSLNCVIKPKLYFSPFILTFFGVLLYRGYLHQKVGKITMAQYISHIVIAFFLLNHMTGVLNQMKNVVDRLGIINYAMEVFETCSTPRVNYTGKALTQQGFSIQNIDFSYFHQGKQRVIFKDFNLIIEPKKITLIGGPIGSGKSTLISLLLKYHTPQKGEIFFNGKPYSTIMPNDIRREIFYIPQNPILFNRSVYDNIIYGIKDPVSKEEVEKTIRSLNLGEFLDKLPSGLDTNVGKYGSKLSGGQRQIIWILKIIIINPEFLILDEPTSSIDEATKEIVRYLLTYVMKNKTVIMITHDPYLRNYVDRIIHLDQGVIKKDEYVNNEHVGKYK